MGRVDLIESKLLERDELAAASPGEATREPNLSQRQKRHEAT